MENFGLAGVEPASEIPTYHFNNNRINDLETTNCNLSVYIGLCLVLLVPFCLLCRQFVAIFGLFSVEMKRDHECKCLLSNF